MACLFRGSLAGIKNMKRTLHSWLLLLALTASLFAQNLPPEVVFWSRALNGLSGNRVLELLADASQPPWPELRTPHWIGKLPPAEQASYKTRSALAKGLLTKLKEDFRPEAPVSLAELDKELNQYLVAARRLEATDGYTNRVLEDCFYQLALFRLSGWLVAHPTAFDEVARRAEALAVPKLDVVALLLRYKSEDAQFDEIKLNVATVDPKQSLYEQLKQAGLDQKAAIAWATKPEDGDSRALIDRPSLVHLLARVAVTDSDRRSLLGMAEYLRRGGKLDDAALNDFGKFQKVMGRDVYNYGSGWLSQRFIDGGVLMRIRDRHLSRTPQAVEVSGSWTTRIFD